MVQELLRILKVIRKKDFYAFRDRKINNTCLGNKGASWTIHPDDLSDKSIVYSFGVGEDISFDLALIEKFGITIHAFDPTPKSIGWVKSQQLPKQFVLHEIGLAAYDGVANFALPENPDHVSATILHKSSTSNFFNAEVRRLKTITSELSHSSIDILKMDIEGAEYDVLDDFISSDIEIKQLLVEFHHRFDGIGIRKSQEAIQKLRKAGYAIFSVSPNGEEFSFMKL
jgi:FkbM family methyltransferase